MPRSTDELVRLMARYSLGKQARKRARTMLDEMEEAGLILSVGEDQWEIAPQWAEVFGALNLDVADESRAAKRVVMKAAA